MPSILRSKPQQRILLCCVAGLLFALALAAYMYKYVNENGRETVLSLAQTKADQTVTLTEVFVRTYSQYGSQFGDGQLPIPAVFRADALAHVEMSHKEGGMLNTGVVGLPGREIKEVASDEAIRAQLFELQSMTDSEKSTKTISSVIENDGQRTHRSLWAFLALEQTCVDCHNRIQNLSGEDQWKLGDLMGAQIVEQDIELQLKNVSSHATVQAVLLFVAVAAGWFCCMYLAHHFRLTQKLKILATTDPLTGCMNRREFQDRVSTLSDNATGALIMCDLDNFKSINDTYGHAAGDKVIRDFTDRTRLTVRGDDWVARFGGEEFVIWLSGVRAINAIRIAERIREDTERAQIEVNGSTIQYTVSIGLHIVNEESNSEYESWLQSADSLVYKAKQQGRNRIVCDVSVAA